MRQLIIQIMKDPTETGFDLLGNSCIEDDRHGQVPQHFSIFQKKLFPNADLFFFYIIKLKRRYEHQQL